MEVAESLLVRAGTAAIEGIAEATRASQLDTDPRANCVNLLTPIACACALGGLFVCTPVRPSDAAEGSLPSPLVYLKAIDPTIIQDMRYASAENFTGARVEGYAAAECILTRATARSLSEVQTDLRSRGLSLKVYDCYRPVRAVAAFMAWTWKRDAGNPVDRNYHPHLRRSELVPQGYIASHSAHSRGNTVDLTLVELHPSDSATHEKSGGVCDGTTDESVDMGTSFDCFDPRSHRGNAGLTPRQREWRQTLADAMRSHGFRGYVREWWHFTYPSEGARAFDVPITAPDR
jgi:D-alanyl-D-alanine dipeptidase